MGERGGFVSASLQQPRQRGGEGNRACQSKPCLGTGWSLRLPPSPSGVHGEALWGGPHLWEVRGSLLRGSERCQIQPDFGPFALFLGVALTKGEMTSSDDSGVN